MIDLLDEAPAGLMVQIDTVALGRHVEPYTIPSSTPSRTRGGRTLASSLAITSTCADGRRGRVRERATLHEAVVRSAQPRILHLVIVLQCHGISFRVRVSHNVRDVYDFSFCARTR